MFLAIKMSEVTWPVIDRAFNKSFPLIIPLGAACKEHGYHLPMNTDLIISEYLVDWIMANYSVLIAPTITYSFFPAFVEYSGSATISYEVAVNFIKDLCLTWHQQGAKQFYVLNTGISTNQVLAQVSNILRSESIQFNYFDFSTLMKGDEIKELEQQKIGSHADEIESSIMLYIKPEVVDLTKAIVEESPDKPGSLTRDIKARDRTISVSGAWGNPTLATREKGKKVMEYLIELLEKDLDKLFPQSKKS